MCFSGAANSAWTEPHDPLFQSCLMASEECCTGCEGITRSWQDMLISSQRLVRDQDFSLQLFPLIKQSIHSGSWSTSLTLFELPPNQKDCASKAGWCCLPASRLRNRSTKCWIQLDKSEAHSISVKSWENEYAGGRQVMNYDNTCSTVCQDIWKAGLSYVGTQISCFLPKMHPH